MEMTEPTFNVGLGYPTNNRRTETQEGKARLHFAAQSNSNLRASTTEANW